jgi:hypothetical protein
MSLGDRVLLEALRLARRARRRKVGADEQCSATLARGRTGEAASRAAITASRTSTVRADAAMTAREECSDVRASGAPAAAASSIDATLSGKPSTDASSWAAAGTSDPFALDARLAEAARVLRTIEPRIGRLLRVIIDQHIHGSFGYRAFDDYVRDRLGIGIRKAWALLAIEKAVRRSPDFDRAYRDGRLSWVRPLSLLPVLERTTAPAWIARAESVTVRRLADEVEWVLAARDAFGPSVSLAPPPVDSRSSSPDAAMPRSTVTPPDQCRDSSPQARLHIRAHEDCAALLSAPSMAERQKAPEVVDAEIRFTGPASVVALLRDVLDAFADPDEPRWTALERLLRQVVTHWESTPRHPDPVFARDGWRCTVPACSSRRNLHDHHIRFRSRGGDNRRDNRTTVCAAHHLHGLHAGTIQASGVAPHAIAWQLGVRPGAPPFLAFVGDRLCQPEDAGTAARREALPRP